MGCGTSNGNGSAVDNYNRRPKISVRIQAGAKKLDNEPSVVFIFGGPGSRKGRVVDDLVNSYGFHFISAEDVIIEEFSKKMGSTANVKVLIEEHGEQLTLDWLCDVLIQKIEQKGTTAKCIIDILPSLKCMLKYNSLIRDCQRPLDKFEQKFPVSFALNLAVPVDKVLKAKQVYCAEPGKQDKLSREGQSDEMDTSRTQKRASQYEQQVKTYLEYFSRTQRLITVDVTCGVADIIWNRVHEVMVDLDFIPLRTVNTVLIFSFQSDDIAQLDTDKFVIDVVHLSELVNNPNDSVENLLKAICTYVDNHSQENESFAVICEGTTLAQRSPMKVRKKPIIFVDGEEAAVERYLPGSPKQITLSKRGGNTSVYKAVASLENEVCLFPSNTPDTLCTSVAAIMAKNREVH